MRDLNIPDSTMLLTLGARLPRAESQGLHSKRLKYCQGTDENRATALRGVLSFGGALYCFPEVEADPEMGGAASDAWALERDRLQHIFTLNCQAAALTNLLATEEWQRQYFAVGIVDLLGQDKLT